MISGAFCFTVIRTKTSICSVVCLQSIKDVGGGCGSAFVCVIVSAKFEGLNTLKRHRYGTFEKNTCADCGGWLLRVHPVATGIMVSPYRCTPVYCNKSSVCVRDLREGSTDVYV